MRRRFPCRVESTTNALERAEEHVCMFTTAMNGSVRSCDTKAYAVNVSASVSGFAVRFGQRLGHSNNTCVFSGEFDKFVPVCRYMRGMRASPFVLSDLLSSLRRCLLHCQGCQ